MTRGLTAGMLSEITATVVRPLFLFEMEFVGSTLYLSSGHINVSWNAQTWLANGFLYPFDAVKETTDLRANSVTIELGAIDSSLMSLLLASTNQGKVGRLYLALLNSSNAIIADPYLIFKGTFDNCQISESGTDAIASVTYENDLVRLNKVNEFRYTKQSWEVLFAGDKGFDYVSTIEDWSGFWGKAARPKIVRARKRASQAGRN